MRFRIPAAAFAALSLILSSSPAWAKHGSAPFTEKVAESEVIIVGTVTSVQKAAPREGKAARIEATAHVVATVKVQTVLRGSPGETIEVGFRTEYMCDTVNLEADGTYLLFLQKVPATYYATVNWEYGAYPIKNEWLKDPTERFMGREILIGEAVQLVRAALAACSPKPPTPADAAGAELGRVQIAGTEASVRLREVEGAFQVDLVRPGAEGPLPGHVEAWLLTDGGRALLRMDPPHGRGAGESSPNGFTFVPEVARAQLAAVVIAVDGKPASFAVPAK